MASSATSIPTRGSSSRRALVVALAFGLISALLVFTFLNRAGSSSGGLATTPVLVAAQDIALGEEITEQNVTLKALPTVARHPNSFTDKTKDSALHQVATVPVAAGEQVLSTQVTKNQAEVGLAAQIPEGHRAISISVTEVTSGAGFIKPGDFVDVIGTFQANTTAPSGQVLAAPKGDNGDKVYFAATVLQNVKVLAIGQTAQLPQQGSVAASTNNLKPSADQAQAKSVTLALTPDEAQKVILSESIGTLRLAGRRLGDKDPAQVQPQDNRLSGLLAPPNR